MGIMGDRTKYEIRLNDQARWFVDKVYSDKPKAEAAFENHTVMRRRNFGAQLVRVWARLMIKRSKKL